MSLPHISRLLIIKNKNVLTIFYPSKLGNHRFSEPDELPFDKVSPNDLVDIDNDNILIFPSDKKAI
jgi:hypothetical protein